MVMRGIMPPPLPLSIALTAVQLYRWKQQEGSAAASSSSASSLILWLGSLVAAAYLPYYVDGSALDGRRAGAHSRKFVAHPIFRFIWRRCLGMPLCAVEWQDKEFASSSKRDARFIFCSHPHGVASAHHIGPMICPGVCEGEGRSFADVPGADPAIRRDLSASVLFRVPVLREVMLWAGCVDASRSVAERLLRGGGKKKTATTTTKRTKEPFKFGDPVAHSLAILVGGEQEQLLAQKGEHTVFVNKRKGHVRLSLRFGVPLVPCYAFGEVDTYTTSAFLLPLRLWLVKALGVALPVAWGRSLLLPFLPRPTKITHCVGTPIYPYGANGETAPEGGVLPDKPSQEAVDALHARYVEGLRAVFERHKAACGYPKAVLKVV